MLTPTFNLIAKLIQLNLSGNMKKSFDRYNLEHEISALLNWSNTILKCCLSDIIKKVSGRQSSSGNNNNCYTPLICPKSKSSPSTRGVTIFSPKLKTSKWKMSRKLDPWHRADHSWYPSFVKFRCKLVNLDWEIWPQMDCIDFSCQVQQDISWEHSLPESCWNSGQERLIEIGINGRNSETVCWKRYSQDNC